ncbi:MAG: SRPBCC family protein [Ilumatobacteraceae bacterium]
MIRTHISRTMDVSAKDAFAIFIDLDRWPEWGPSVRSATIDDGPMRLGSTGVVTTTVGVRLPYIVTSFVSGKSWAWTVAGVPATDHLVEPLGPGRCRVTFGVPLVAAPYMAVCAIALRRIERIALQPSDD